MVPGDGMSIGFARLIPRSARDCLRHPVCGALGAPGHRTCGSIPPPSGNHKKNTRKTGVFLWCLGTESNRRHRDFQSLALPTELPRQSGRKGVIHYFSDNVQHFFLFFKKNHPPADFFLTFQNKSDKKNVLCWRM